MIFNLRQLIMILCVIYVFDERAVGYNGVLIDYQIVISIN